jgi:NADH-quinone oxidoreductase subunit N
LGTLNLKNINLLLAFNIDIFSSELGIFVLAGSSFIICTLLFKLTCVPFHFWSPDVYDGAPISSTLVLSVLPKLSLFYFFIKLINSLNNVFVNINFLLLTLGISSALVGTLFAINQKRLKRLIIYSSIAQTGFLISGLSTGNIEGYTSVYFFLYIYLITSIMIWGHFIVFYAFYSRTAIFCSSELNPLFLSSLSNLFKKNSLWCFSFIIIFFSVGGIPPLSGFLSKMFILYELVNYKKIIGAILLIFVSAVSIYYYIRLIKILCFESKNSNTSNNDSFKVIFFNEDLDRIYLLFAIILFCIIILFYFPTLILTFSQYIAIHSFVF